MLALRRERWHRVGELLADGARNWLLAALIPSTAETVETAVTAMVPSFPFASSATEVAHLNLVEACCL